MCPRHRFRDSHTTYLSPGPFINFNHFLIFSSQNYPVPMQDHTFIHSHVSKSLTFLTINLAVLLFPTTKTSKDFSSCHQYLQLSPSEYNTCICKYVALVRGPPSQTPTFYCDHHKTYTCTLSPAYLEFLNAGQTARDGRILTQISSKGT